MRASGGLNQNHNEQVAAHCGEPFKRHTVLYLGVAAHCGEPFKRHTVPCPGVAAHCGEPFKSHTVPLSRVGRLHLYQ